MKIHSLSIHHYANGGVGEVPESTKHSKVTDYSDVIQEQK